MSTLSTSPALQAIGLRKAYPGRGTRPDVQALDGLSFEAARGTVFGLLGPNGAGKSTTVRILTTPVARRRGNAVVAGVDVAREPAGVRRAIGLVSQRPSGDPMATGRENLLLPAASRACRARGTDRRRVAAAPVRAHRRRRPAREDLLRRDEPQLDVAMGLVHRPEVLFLDEPTTGLDPEARADDVGGDRAARRRGEADDPAHHPLPRGGRPARPPAGDRRRAAGSWSTAAPDELKRELRGDTVTVELASPTDASTGPRSSSPTASRGVRGPPSTARTLHARVDNGARAVPAVLARARRRPAIGVDAVDRRATLARRRLPPPRGPQLRGRPADVRTPVAHGVPDGPARCGPSLRQPSSSASPWSSRWCGCCCSAQLFKRSSRSPASADGSLREVPDAWRDRDDRHVHRRRGAAPRSRTWTVA